MAEIIDIVNENDEVVGQATKDDAHLKRLPHRIGTVYIFYKGKLLVQGRSLEKDGLLDHSSAGHVHTGESYADAAAREMFEEVGIRGSLKYVGTVSSERERGDNSRFRHWFGLFEIELSDEQFHGMKLSEREVAEMIPMTLTEIAELMRKERKNFSGGFPLTLRLYSRIKRISLGEIPLEK